MHGNRSVTYRRPDLCADMCMSPGVRRAAAKAERRADAGPVAPGGAALIQYGLFGSAPGTTGHNRRYPDACPGRCLTVPGHGLQVPVMPRQPVSVFHLFHL